MNKILGLFLIGSVLIFGSSKYNGSTTASVTLAGGIIKAQDIVVTKKYKRKDCPVCEGKGWYISGDKITKVNCGYCEPPAKESNIPSKIVIHSPINLSPNCATGTCSQNRK